MFKNIACILIYLVTIFLFVKLAFVFIAGSCLSKLFWNTHTGPNFTSVTDGQLNHFIFAGKQADRNLNRLVHYYFIKPNNCFASSEQTNITVV